MKKNRKNFSKRSLQQISMCIIPMLLVLVFNYFPMYGIIIAFKDYKYNLGILGSEWVGFENFKVLVLSNDFARVTWNTIYLNALMIVVGIIAAVLLAVLLYEITSRRATKVYQTVLITPNFLSWVVVGYIAYALLNPNYGFLNNTLESMGFNRIDWYSEAEYWPVILLIFFIWKNVGMDSIIYYASLMGVDSSLFEAAEIDGANKRQIIRYIMIPSLAPIVTVMFILKVGNIFRADFGLFYQLTRDVGALYSTTDVIDTYLYRTMRVVGDMGLSSAIGLLQSIVGMITVLVANTIAKKIDPERGLF